MVGYKDPEFIHIGWFSARLDSVANWLPARLTALLTIISAALIGQSASGALRILLRDRNRTESWNAGWVMSTMAGALGIELEKQRYYVLGDAHEMLAWGHLVKANRIMTLNIILFLLFVTLPTMLGIEKMRWLMYGIECACQ
jgi:adenosylcobinamide-phosphate synthase